MENPTNTGQLTHLDEHGRLHMVDVSGKDSTVRLARAEAILMCTKDTANALLTGNVSKGEACAAARLAGIMAAKQTQSLIPLCHSLPLDAVSVQFEPHPDGIRIFGEAKCTGKTGVEMEALMAVSVAGLTLYDMGKSREKTMVLSGVALLEKSGGKSGHWRRHAPTR